MHIAIDLDDVLVDYWNEMLAFYNMSCGTMFRKEQFFSYEAWRVFGGTYKECIDTIESFHMSPAFKIIPALPHARETMTAIARHHTCTVVTGRPEYTAPATNELINKHFPGIFSAVHFTNLHARGITPGSKKDVCVALGAHLLVEDHLGHALPCAEQGIRVLLFDQPWNRKEVPAAEAKNITRVSSWNHIANLIL